MYTDKQTTEGLKQLTGHRFAELDTTKIHLGAQVGQYNEDKGKDRLDNENSEIWRSQFTDVRNAGSQIREADILKEKKVWTLFPPLF